jgi:hypothetical protein
MKHLAPGEASAVGARGRSRVAKGYHGGAIHCRAYLTVLSKAKALDELLPYYMM